MKKLFVVAVTAVAMGLAIPSFACPGVIDDALKSFDPNCVGDAVNKALGQPMEKAIGAFLGSFF